MLSVWLYIFLGLTTLVASSTNSVFTNSFLVRFQRSIENDMAHEIAARNGFENVGEVRFILACKPQIIAQFRVFEFHVIWFNI